MVGSLSLAFALTLLGGTLAEEPYNYWNDASSNQLADSYWHGPSHPTGNKFLRRQDLDLFGSALPALLFSTAGALASIAFTSLRADDLSRRIDTEKDNINTEKARVTALNDRVQTITTRLAMSEANQRQTCNAIRGVVTKTNPMHDPAANTPPATPAGNPVSGNLGLKTGQYPYFNVLVQTGTTATPGTLPLTAAEVRGVRALGTSTDDAAMSLVDFNIFRIQVIDVINILDLKIREILAVQAPVCA